MEVHKIEVPLQLPEPFDNLRIVEAVHLHRDLRNRGQQLVGGPDERIPLPTLNVHLDDQAPASVAVLPDLVFQRVEKMRGLVAAAIADTFVVKHKRAAVTSWPGWIKTVVLMHRDVIPARQLASPVVVAANAVRVPCIERLDQILAHQVSAIVGAAEALQRTIFQDDRLEFRKNRLTQPARRGPAHDIANRNGGRCGESDDDKRDADSMSSHEGVLHRSRPIKTILKLLILPSICPRLRRCTFQNDTGDRMMLGMAKRDECGSDSASRREFLGRPG